MYLTIEERILIHRALMKEITRIKDVRKITDIVELILKIEGG